MCCSLVNRSLVRCLLQTANLNSGKILRNKAAGGQETVFDSIEQTLISSSSTECVQVIEKNSGKMATQKPVEWVAALITRFEDQLPCKTGPQTHHSKICATK